MDENYHLFSNGTLKRDQNTLRVDIEDSTGGPHYIPVESVGSIFCHGQINVNTRVLDFLSQHGIVLHVFNWNEYYSGSYIPRRTLVSGNSTVEQALHYSNSKKRMVLARSIVGGSADEMVANIQYYRRKNDDLSQLISPIKKIRKNIENADDVSELLGVEGSIRSHYYRLFQQVTPAEFEFTSRQYRPPPNELNSLISFGNSLLYGTILGELYKTHLDPTISYLHEPSERRFSLALDISEVFKPAIVDRLILRLVNRKQISKADFEKSLNGCLLTDTGRKLFVREFEKVLERTVEHPRLKRHVSYQYLIRLEAYKLHKHILGDKEYEPFSRWW